MSERSEYNDGEFCWVDLATTDAEAAKSFYGELLGVGWEPAGDQEQTGNYGFLTRRGKQVAGLGPAMEDGLPPSWASYVKVESADETAEKVREAGGGVAFGPIDLPNGAGRMALCQDPTDAFVSVIEQQRHPGAELVNETGCWTWNNLLTRDVEEAKRFYGEAFGWEATHNEGAPADIHNWQIEGQRWPEGLGGLMAMPEGVPAAVPSYWEVYFAVDDLDEAIEKTERAGGRPMIGPLEIPVGRIAALTDPQGAAVSLIEPDYPEPR